VLAAIGVEAAPAGDTVLDERLAAVRAVIADAPAAADEVAVRTGLAPATVAAALAELELLGLRRRSGRALPGGDAETELASPW